jgi:crotonobetainyl-CoA:carnitine CoA-transferase CaiB-like acyl-CoA transferase
VIETAVPSDNVGESRGSLAGLTVIDLSTGIAAPSSTMLLADHGATVISVERPDSPNMNRTAAWQIDGTSAWWYLLGRNKYAITLNLKDSRGIELLKRLIESADVLVENFRPGKLEAMGLEPKVLHSINSKLIILRLSGWGQDGPYATNPAYGSLVEAMSGLAYGTGDPDGPPMLSSFAIADPVAGYLGAFAIMAALWGRERDANHAGEVIDLSLLEAQFNLLGPQAMAYDALGAVSARFGSRSPTFAPRNVYRTNDSKYVVISASAQNIVNRCFDAIGRPELCDDPRFCSPESRHQNLDEIDEVFASWIAEHSAQDVINTLRAAEATVAPVYSIEDILRDEHFLYRRMIETVPAQDGLALKMQSVVPRMAQRPGQLKWAGEGMGASNVRWFVERLGIDEHEFRQLKRDGVI